MVSWWAPRERSRRGEQAHEGARHAGVPATNQELGEEEFHEGADVTGSSSFAHWLAWRDRDDARVRLTFGEDAGAGADGRSAEAEAPFPERRGPSGTLASVGERSLPEGGESQGAPRPFIKNASRPPDVKETPRCFGRSVETRRARCLPYLSVATQLGDPHAEPRAQCSGVRSDGLAT